MHKEIAKLDCVARINEWNGRYYINLEAAHGSGANADLRSKLWIKGDVLTYEKGKGYHSHEWTDARDEVAALVTSLGGKYREA